MSEPTVASVSEQEQDAVEQAINEIDAEIAAAEADADNRAADTALDGVVEEQEPFIDAPTDAIADALAQTAQQFDNVAAEKRQEGVAADPVFDGPFDAAKAWAAVSELNELYQAAIKEEERTKKLHAGAKAERDDLGKELSDTIAKLNGRQRDGQLPLATVTEADETIDDRRARLAVALEARGWIVTAHDLKPFDRTELDTFDTWISREGPIPPDAVARLACVAGPPGERGQSCAKCGKTLAPSADPLPIASFVGANCKGEAARPVKKTRAKKTKRIDHEAVRKEQSTGQQKES